MTGRPSAACHWAELALLGVAVNLAVLVIAPIVRPDLDLLNKALSYYAVGPWAMLQTVAFASMGLASLALAVALLQAPISSTWVWLTIALLAISGIAALGLVWFPMGVPSVHTFIGDMHQTSGTIGGIAQLAAALAFALAIRTDARWKSFFYPAIVALMLGIIGAIITQAEIWWPHLPIPMGASMRLVVIPLVLLWGAVAWRLRQRCAIDANQSFSGT